MGIEYNGGPRVLNGLTGATQTFAVASSGTDFGIASSGIAHTFSIPDASDTARGLISTGTQTIAGAKSFSGNILPTTTATYTLGNTSFRWTSIWASSTVIAPTLWLGSLQSQLTADATAVVVMAGSSGERLSQLKIGNAGGVNWYFPADNTVEQRNSTNAQTFRVYNTYTSSTSGEYGQASWASNEFRIGTAVGSAGGTQRNVVIGTWNAAGTWKDAITVNGSSSPVVSITPYWAPGFTITAPVLGALTASTEFSDVNFNLSATKSWNAGTITTQRAFRIQAPTYAFASASTITTASTLSISGAPIAGTNATISTAFSLYSEGGLVGSVGDVIITTAAGAFGVRSGPAGANRIQMKGGSGLEMASAYYVAWGPSSTSANSPDLFLRRDDAGILALRNAANVQSFGVYGTWTSTTSYERVNVRGKASASFEIGPENGSAGGTLRGLTIGGYSAGSTTITPWLSFTSSGTPTFDQGTVVIPSGGTGLMCQQTNIYLESYGTHSGIRYRRSEGTQGSPTGVALNSLVGFIGTYGYHTGSAYHTTKGASIDFYATEAYTSGAQGTKIVFGTTPNGTTTNTVALTIDQNQVATFSKLVAQSAAEITSTPSGTTQTITLNDGNHQTLTLTSSTGAVTATLTVPSNVSSGTIIVKQHGSTPRNITWAVSAGTIKWMGTEPTWSSDAANDIRIVSWRYDGSVMYLMSTDKAA